jgi:hypothetical protein
MEEVNSTIDNLKVGTIIDCEEAAGNQTILHQYNVEKIINNMLISYFSKPSLVKIKLPWKEIEIESKSNTYVVYDFEKIMKMKLI